MNKSKHLSTPKKSILLLENGEFFYGSGVGALGTTIGEICFNTSITGYQEIMTDPSYKGQIITFTFPHIGITGVNRTDYESDKIFASGCIVNNPFSITSNFRSENSFENWLKTHNKMCITGIDTRELTQKIRDNGYFKVLISTNIEGKYSITNLKSELKNHPSLESNDMATGISTKTIFEWSNGKKKKIDNNFSNLKKSKFIAVLDFGIKANILNLLELTGYQVIVFPISFKSEKIMKLKPCGIFLSNGPGDPKSTYYKNKNNLDFLFRKRIPIFGICLGHQILALAHNATTVKMHHGHRGANHPIKNLLNQNVEITVQNHGFVVSKTRIPDNIVITHKSLFDNTIAGLKIKNKPFFSVQYHPEASPGPRDSRYLFEQFRREIDKYAKKK